MIAKSLRVPCFRKLVLVNLCHARLKLLRGRPGMGFNSTIQTWISKMVNLRDPMPRAMTS